MSRRRRRVPKGAYPLPEGGYAVDKSGIPIVVGSGEVRVDPEWQSHPNMRLLARALLAAVEEQRRREGRRIDNS